jgi:hypothetical protein
MLVFLLCTDCYLVVTSLGKVWAFMLNVDGNVYALLRVRVGVATKTAISA